MKTKAQFQIGSGDQSCTMDWYERVNWPPRDLIRKVSTAEESHWYNIAERNRTSRGATGEDLIPAFKDWEDARQMPCAPRSVEIPDKPSLDSSAGGWASGANNGRFTMPSGKWRHIDPTLDIFIRFMSGEMCQCNVKQVVVSVRQILKSSNRGGLQIQGSTIRFRKTRNGPFMMPPRANTMGGAYVFW